MIFINTITYNLDLKAENPLYIQLYEYLKTEIIKNKIVCGCKLPSKRQLSLHLQCSLNTVQAAYSQLESEGYITSKPKSGFYVCKLDNVINIHIESVVSSKSTGDIQNYIYDFSYHGIDQDTFPFLTWRRIAKDVINEYDSDLLKTGHPQGYAELRSSITNYLHHSRGVECSPSQIIISSGTEFLLQQLIQLFNDNCIFAIENPGYEKLNHIFKSNRASFVPLPIDDSGVTIQNLLKSQANIVCVTPSHQFPTGNIMPVNRRIQLLNWAHEKDERYIIEDDYDSEFKYGGKPIPSLQGLDMGRKVIYIGAFSKSLTPALRISYMVMPEILLEEYKEKLNFYICPVPTIEQKILSRFINEGYFERHLNKMRNIYKTKRETLVAAINQLMPGNEITGANAGLHLILKVKSKMSEAELVEKAQNSAIKVYGISQYYFDNVPKENYPLIILGFASLKTDEIFNAVTALKNSWYKN